MSSMKFQHVRGPIFVKRQEVPWDEPIVAKLGELSWLSFFAKLSGLHDDPRALMRCRVSGFSRVYATLLGSLSLAFTFQTFLHAVSPSLVSEEFALATLTSMRDMSIFIRPIYSTALTSFRIGMAVGLHRKRNLIHIRRVVREIASDPYLRNHSVNTRKIKKILSLATCIYILWTAAAGTAFVLASPSLARKPLFYLVMFEIYLYVSAVCVAGSNLLVVSLFVVLPLLRNVADIFGTAVSSADTRLMRTAIACHDTCRRLIECIDGFASYFLGISVLSGVPIIAIAASTVSRFAEYQAGFGFRATMVFAFAYLLFTAFFILVASAVHCEAHRPQEILTENIIVNEELLTLSTQFLARFQVKSLGYTFFRIVTIRRETILSFFSLITTYVIIAFQLKSC